MCVCVFFPNYLIFGLYAVAVIIIGHRVASMQCHVLLPPNEPREEEEIQAEEEEDEAVKHFLFKFPQFAS